MGCLGVYYALSNKQSRALVKANGDDEVRDLIEQVEEDWDEKWLQETDKAWDAIHRCLTDGTLSFEASSSLHKCVIGGIQLYEDDDYIVSFLSPNAVKEVAAAIQPISIDWMRAKYYQIPTDDYGFALTEEDFQYTWHWFECVKGFFRKVAESDRAVVFTADQ